MVRLKKLCKWMIILFCGSLCAGCSAQADGELENTTGTEELTLTEAVDHDISDVEETDLADISEDTYENADENADEDEEIDERVEAYIESYVDLSEDTEVEKYEWMEYDDEQVLRIAVWYKEPPENDYQHKEDYFLFITQDESVSQIVHVDYENIDIAWGCGFDAHFEDVTFDNHKDLLIFVGHGMHTYHYCVYVYEDGGFRYEETFNWIPSYVVDSDNEVIYGSDIIQAGSIQYDYTYKYKNGKFVLIEEKETTYGHENGEVVLIEEKITTYDYENGEKVLIGEETITYE